MRTGVNGRVVLASRCPVPLGGDDSPCPTVPLATAVAVRSADGSTEVAQVATDANGQFAVAVAPGPGEYLVVVPARAQTVPLTVSAEGPTPLTIQVRPSARTVP